jgi:chromate reductase, NAD(P)H dehydrogenase (quinone)
MTAPEAYTQYSLDVFANEGEVTNDATASFLSSFMSEFRTYIERVLTVIPRS